MSSYTTVTTQFHNVKVTVSLDESGTPQFGCDPESVTVDRNNSVISYQLISAPEGIVFWGVQISPAKQNQFKPPQITAEGRMLSLDDIDNELIAEDFQVTLQLTSTNLGAFTFDPQILNRPY